MEAYFCKASFRSSEEMRSQLNTILEDLQPLKSSSLTAIPEKEITKDIPPLHSTAIQGWLKSRWSFALPSFIAYIVLAAIKSLQQQEQGG